MTYHVLIGKLNAAFSLSLSLSVCMCVTICVCVSILVVIFPSECRLASVIEVKDDGSGDNN